MLFGTNGAVELHGLIHMKSVIMSFEVFKVAQLSLQRLNTHQCLYFKIWGCITHGRYSLRPQRSPKCCCEGLQNKGYLYTRLSHIRPRSQERGRNSTCGDAQDLVS